MTGAIIRGPLPHAFNRDYERRFAHFSTFLADPLLDPEFSDSEDDSYRPDTDRREQLAWHEIAALSRHSIFVDLTLPESKTYSAIVIGRDLGCFLRYGRCETGSEGQCFLPLRNYAD